MTANIGELARKAFDNWMKGTGYVADLFSPDMTWEIVGHSAASAKYSTAQEFQDKVLTPFAQRFKPEEPFRPVKIARVLRRWGHRDRILGRLRYHDRRVRLREYLRVDHDIQRWSDSRWHCVLRQHFIQRALENLASQRLTCRGIGVPSVVRLGVSKSREVPECDAAPADGATPARSRYRHVGDGSEGGV